VTTGEYPLLYVFLFCPRLGSFVFCNRMTGGKAGILFGVQGHLFFLMRKHTIDTQVSVTFVNIPACWVDSMNCKVSRTRRKPLAVADRGLPSWAISRSRPLLNPHVINSRAVFHRLTGVTQQATSLRFYDLYSLNIQVVEEEVDDACRHHPCSWNAGQMMTASPNPTNNSGSSPRIPALLHGMARSAGPHIKA
jgi:hypothetical protein